MNRKFGKNDVIFLAVLALLTVLSLAVLYTVGSGQTGSYVVVTVDGEEFGRYSLSEDRTVEIANRDGTVTNTLVIRDGCAAMAEADCPDKLCVRQKKISKNHENIVCLPNRVVVQVESGQESGVDAIAN